jgi:tRNA pseudouridine32 synthase/23S rRNA pseudouridine746 synthase
MQRKVFLVHRIDREASGLMLIAHTKEAAARLSELLRTRMISKGYRIEVAGNLEERGKTGTINLPLDGKEALTEYEVTAYDPDKNITTVSVFIKTGRLHQIRRHFEMINFPVMGDPHYGKENKNRDGMKLTAVSLRFICPFSRAEVQFSV